MSRAAVAAWETGPRAVPSDALMQAMRLAGLALTVTDATSGEPVDLFPTGTGTCTPDCPCRLARDGADPSGLGNFCA